LFNAAAGKLKVTAPGLSGTMSLLVAFFEARGNLVGIWKSESPRLPAYFEPQGI
jgi:hypothetical protein